MISKDKSKVAPGKWVNLRSMLIDGICSRPYRVTRVNKSRVYYIPVDRRGEERDEEYCNISSVVFVCDIKAEADAMHSLAEELLVELRIVKQRFKDQADAMCEGGGQ